MKIGFDFGSRNIHAAVLDGDRIVETFSRAHNGNIRGVFGEIANDLSNRHPDAALSFGVTGRGISSRAVAMIDPVLATVEAARFLRTASRNILSIGCGSFSLVLLDENRNYIEHTVNTDCASGTGSFIDQQAERLGFTPEELSRRAAEFRGQSPSIATRCAVFAKSDIIHAQAQGFGKDAIAAGICEGMARSILANSVKGRRLEGKIVVIGGVSANKKIVSEIEKTLGIPAVVLPESVCWNAIGAAALAANDWAKTGETVPDTARDRVKRDPLDIRLTRYPDFSADRTSVRDGVEVTLYEDIAGDRLKVYLGIDIGSTSTKAVVTDGSLRVLAGLYTRTKGDPVGAVHSLFEQLKLVFSGVRLEFLGVGTTGSGRALVRSVLGADLAVNEITAHAKAAALLDPEVDTIIEIGGQDSKFTVLKNGQVENAVMNYVCAAGTGSFIEEQAGRLGIALDDISGLALGKRAPYTSDRCTVYMERDLNTFLAEGWDKSEIIASVLYSVRDNYLSKVVGKTPLGKKIYFQGATARNKALVAVFENALGKPILVSRYCHLTGALGTAVHMRDAGLKASAFRGIDFRYSAESEICRLCSNQCDLKVYTMADGRKTAWGLKCGREYEDKKVGVLRPVSQLEQDYHALLSRAPADPGDGARRETIGIPVTLYLSEYQSLFADFFSRLGYPVRLERGTAAKMKDGLSRVNADFCAPMTLTHGIVHSLAAGPSDWIFFPAFINEQHLNPAARRDSEERFLDKTTDSYFCFYSEYAPTVVDNLPDGGLGHRLLSPRIKLNNRPVEKTAEEISAYLSDRLGTDPQITRTAFLDSIWSYRDRTEQWRASLSDRLARASGKPKVMLLGRPYSVFDREMNQGIPARLESLGFELLYQSLVPWQDPAPAGEPRDSQTLFDRMHWRYGQEILNAALFAANRPDVYPVFLSCFRCSPDAYALTYFKDMMQKIGRPYLVIQLDELSSDVGTVTRVEAAAESFRNHYSRLRSETHRSPADTIRKTPNAAISRDDTVLIPFLSPVVSVLQAEAFSAAGYPAHVLPLDQSMIQEGARTGSGGECLPNVAIIGSLLEYVRHQKLDPSRCVLFLQSLCLGCNFNQFPVLARLAAETSGLGPVKIASPNAARSIPELPKELNTALMSVGILGSLLYKLLYRFRPYETVPGSAEKALNDSVDTVRDALRSGRSLFEAASEVRTRFENVRIKTGPRRPRIGILGDLYVKYNPVMNDGIDFLIEELGGEVLLPAYSETVVNLIDADVREHGLSSRILLGFHQYEKRFEEIFADLVGDAFEPPVDECVSLLKEFGIEHTIAGETTINVGRMLYYAKHKLVSAVVHVNPIFCCPGVVTASLFRRIQKETGVPIIDIFYDGTNRPNRIIIPHLYYLSQSQNRLQDSVS